MIIRQLDVPRYTDGPLALASASLSVCDKSEAIFDGYHREKSMHGRGRRLSLSGKLLGTPPAATKDCVLHRARVGEISREKHYSAQYACRFFMYRYT